MHRLSHVMTAFSLLLGALVLMSLRRERIRAEYSVSWLAAAIALFFLSAWPGSDKWFAQWMGVSDPALALMIAGGAVFLVVVYRLSLIISRLKDSNIALTQQLAILEFRLSALGEKLGTDPAGGKIRSR